MKKVSKYDEILEGIKSIKDFREGYFTNFFFSQEQIELYISEDILYKLDNLNGVIFYFKKTTDFINLYFCASSLKNLKKATKFLSNNYSDKIVLDIVGTDKMIEPIRNIFLDNGFKFYTSFTRMSRGEYTIDEVSDINLCIATEDDTNPIYELLYNYFDPLSEQLPLMPELSNWIRNNRVIIYREKTNILGFVIFDLIGLKSYLRYWFVSPEYRDRKIGSLLLRKFFKICEGTKKQIFWVIDTNYNAIKRYKHYGFMEEPMHDNILIKKEK